jgi:hypothetical protein
MCAEMRGRHLIVAVYFHCNRIAIERILRNGRRSGRDVLVEVENVVKLNLSGNFSQELEEDSATANFNVVDALQSVRDLIYIRVS